MKMKRNSNCQNSRKTNRIKNSKRGTKRNRKVKNPRERRKSRFDINSNS